MKSLQKMVLESLEDEAEIFLDTERDLEQKVSEEKEEADKVEEGKEPEQELDTERDLEQKVSEEKEEEEK